MARKGESILNLLVECTWWVSVLASGIAFVFVKFILPSIDFQNMVVNSFAKGLSSVAPFVALILLIPAPIAALNSWRKRRLLDSQKGLDSIRALGWREFEELVGEAYRRQGYTVIENTTAGPDGGLVLVQCKQWKLVKVGVNIVRKLFEKESLGVGKRELGCRKKRAWVSRLHYSQMSSIKQLAHSNVECRLRSVAFNLLLSHKSNWGRVPIFIGRVPKQKLGRLSTFFHKREGPRHRKTEERRVL
jgi:hypothetical protein